MSLNVALNVSVSGLLANQRAIAATSENIANVNTENFARREATFVADAIPNQFAGVNVNVTRASVDRFLQAALYRARADEAGARAGASSLSSVEASFGAPGDNISFSNRLDDAFASLVTLSANPASVAARADALSRLNEAFQSFGRSLDAIDAEQTASLSRLETATARANALLREIYTLNQTVRGSDGAADAIDARLAELASLLPISVSRGPDGRVEVVSGGRTLADSTGHASLGVAPDPIARVTLSRVDGVSGAVSPVLADFGPALASGEIARHLSLLNEELPRLATLIADAASRVATELNAVYGANVGVGASAPSGEPLIVEAGGRFTVNQRLLADPTQFAIARPAAGSPGGLNDGLGAALLADVALGDGASNAREAIARIGAAAGEASRSAETNRVIALEINARAASSGGVNLDEELSNLIIYQRAYGANARVIAAIDELWQTLLSII